jgi:hypothetical protein
VEAAADLVPRSFARRADGFAHALAGGLWAAPPLYLSSPRWGPQLYGKVVSTDREKLLRWGARHGIPPRALQRKDLPDLEAKRQGIRRRVEAYHIDLWGERLRWAYRPEDLPRAATER